MRKAGTHRRQALLARALVAAIFIICVSMFQKITIHSASSPSLSATSVKIPIGGTYNLNIKNKINYATYQWSSSNTKVATVDSKGNVKGINKGTADIICTITSDEDVYRLYCNVTVIKPATIFRIANKVSVLNLGQEYTVQGVIGPKSSDDEITWTSSNKDIASPNKEGKFVAFKEGTVTIVGTTISGKQDSMTFRVVDRDGVVSTQEKLEELLHGGAKRITLKTDEAVKINIPEGDYSDKYLFIEAPQADITNSGVFAAIEIRKTSTKNGWLENAVGNQLNVLGGCRIVVSPFAEANINVDQPGEKLYLENYGRITEMLVKKTSYIEVTGSTKNFIPVTIDVADITLSSTVPLNVLCMKKANLELSSAGGKSIIRAATESAIPSIKSNYYFNVAVGDKDVVKSSSNYYSKVYQLNKPFEDITAINISYKGEAYTIKGYALDLLMGLVDCDSEYMALWLSSGNFAYTYDGQMIDVKGNPYEFIKSVSFKNGQFDGKSFTIEADVNGMVRVTSKNSDFDFTIKKDTSMNTWNFNNIIVTGDYTKLSDFTMTFAAGDTYFLPDSYKMMDSLVFNYKGKNYNIDGSLLAAIDFFVDKDSKYKDIWMNMTNAMKKDEKHTIKVSGTAGRSEKIFTFEGGSLDGKSYIILVNADNSITIKSKASGVSFTVSKDKEESFLKITGAPKELIIAPGFE